MKSKRIFEMFLVLIFIIFFVAGGSAQKETIKLSLGYVNNPTGSEGKSLQFFADTVKEKTNGEIEIIIYPACQLGDYSTEIDNTILGSQDIFVNAANVFARIDPIFSIATIPFLFKDPVSFSRILQKEIGEKQNEIFEENGLVILNQARNMFRGNRVLVSKKPIHSLEDVKGLRCRSFENKVYMEAWKRLGASPIIIPWSETYLALKQNTVEAVGCTFTDVYDMKFTEVAPYITYTCEYMSDLIFAMNKEKFDTLTLEQQQILVECANSTGDYLGSIVGDMEKQDIKKMKEEGVEFITIDTEPFRAALKEYYYELEKSGLLSHEVLDAAFNE